MPLRYRQLLCVQKHPLRVSNQLTQANVLAISCERSASPLGRRLRRTRSSQALNHPAMSRARQLHGRVSQRIRLMLVTRVVNPVPVYHAPSVILPYPDPGSSPPVPNSVTGEVDERAFEA